MDDHKFILFNPKARIGAVSEMSLLITNQIFKERPLSIKKWKEFKGYHKVGWNDPNNQPQESRPVNYLIISEFIRANNYFSYDHFNLPHIECFWLDHSTDISANMHLHDDTVPNGLGIQDSTSQQQYGKNYPIKPRLIREGQSFTTLQPQLLDRIISLRKLLIEKSNLALEVSWFFDFRSLVNDAISLLDITLNQIYIKAEYDPLPHWKFDLEKLGSKVNRRFEDKLRWIYQISGRNLNAESQMTNVNCLRKLRNHLMHFDPPSLVFTVEEATTWLNQLIDVGYLLIKMRQAIGVEVSLPLIHLILQREALFNPLLHSAARLPINRIDGDYASSIWKNE
jgi:hypothetical protein